jgi:hypothetical protein
MGSIRRNRRRCIAAALTIVVIGAMGLGGAAAEAPAADEAALATSVSIQGTDFLINGEITYKGRTNVELDSGGTANLEGLLLNARMINAVFDDDNGATRSNWKYPSGPEEAWNPDRHTAEFVAMLPAYRERGLLMVTVGLQGGNPASGLAPGNGGTPSWVVSAFNPDGSLKQAWMDRLATVIEAADAQGMVVNVSLFYQRQEHRFTNEAAVKAAVDNATDWLVTQGYTNVIVGIQNEVGSGLWGSGIWRPARAHELIERAKARHPSLIVGTGMRDVIPSDEIVNASDYLAFSANTLSAAETGAFIDDLRDLASWQADPKPILVIEDGPRPSAAEMDTALARDVSFGYHDDGPSGDSFSNYEDGFQWVPANWAINTSPKRTFFDRVARLTGAAPSPPSDSAYELVVSSSPDRSDAVALAEETVSGDVYVFVAPEEGLTAARFWLDDPDRSGAPVQTEGSPPWDFAGGDAQQADPFDTNTVADGSHTITAELDLEGGGVEVVSAAFAVANDSARLSFSPASLSFTVEEGSGSSAQTSELAASDGSSASFVASADRSWVSVSPGSGSTPTPVTVTVDASGLAPGTYGATVTAEGGGYAAGTLAVTLTVLEASASAYELLVSSSPDRSSPVALAGETVSGEMFVFLSPETGVSDVSFFLDDPDMSGAPVQVERGAPYDLAGTESDGTAVPFDSSTLPDGSHEVTALVGRSDGSSEVVSAAFTAANDSPALAFSPDSLSFTVEEGSSASAQTVDLAATDGSAAAFTVSADRTWVGVSPASGSTPATLTVSVEAGGLAPGTYSATVTAEAGGSAAGTLAVTLTVTERPPDGGSYELLLSSSPNRVEPVPLAGTTVGGEIYVFVEPEGGVSEVAFYLDDPDRSGAPVQVERSAPYDLAGTNGDGTAVPFDTASLPDGSHEVTAEVERSDGSSEVVSASLTVANVSPALAFSPESLSFTVEEGSGAVAQTAELAATDGSAAAFTASADRTWVSVSPASGSTPETLTVSVDASGLGPGTHSATLTAEAGGYAAGTLAVTLTVTEATTSAYELVVSSTSDRADPVPLAGATVSGDVYVFLSPSDGVMTVRFWLDDPDRSGRPARREGNPPWDFAGGSVKEAKPFDTTDVADGTHTITAELDLEGGGVEVVSATFTVAN